ncbi:MAG: LEA type 2 family protein [Myxococcaceae bacterium]|nr:LEA type 2 family protein [Myxococcaceae bacterium]
MKRVTGWVLCSVVFFSGCALLRDLLATTFQQPRFAFKRVELANLSLSSVTLNTVWSLENPNNIGLRIAKVDYALFIEGKQVVAGAPALGLEMSPNGTTEIVFPANVRFRDVVPVLETFLTKETARYRAEGSLGFDTPLGVVSFPLAKEGDFEVPKAPQIALRNPRMTQVNLGGATVEFPFTVTNRNGFPLSLGRLTGRLYVGSSSVGEVSTPELGQLAAKGTRTLSVPLTLNFLSTGVAVANAVAGQPSQVRFDGRLEAGSEPFPINAEQVLKFIR